MFTWLNNIRKKVDEIGSGYFQRRMDKQLRIFRKTACMMATIFPWYEKLNEHVNNYLAGQLGKIDLEEIFKDYTYRFGSQYQIVVKGLKKAEITGWEEREIADRKNQSIEDQEHMKRFKLAKEFVYAIEVYFDKLDKLVLSMEIVLKKGNQRKLVSLVEEYMLELRVYQKFCQKYVKKGICEDVDL